MSQNSEFGVRSSEFGGQAAWRWFWRYGIAGMALVATLLLIFVVPAHADAPTSAPSCSGYAGIANRIAGCVLESVDKSARIYFQQFYPYLANTIMAVTLLGVVLYGIMLSLSMVQSLSRDTIMLLIKIGAVSMLTQSSDIMYDYVFSAMNGAAAAVVRVVPDSGNADGSNDFRQVTCLKNMREASEQSGKPVVGPWLAMDCMLDTVVGIKTQNTTSDPNAQRASNPNLSGEHNTVSRGLLNFFFVSMGSSVVGMMLGVIGLLFVWSLLMLIFKTLLTYLMGYIALAFLIILSPLFLPLLLLPGEMPRTYFEKWYKLLIGFAMQPILMLVFVSFFVSAIDLAMFSSDYSIYYRIAGEASRQPGFDINQYLTDGGVISRQPLRLWDNITGKAHPEVALEQGNSLVTGLMNNPNCGTAVLMRGGTEDPSCRNIAPVQYFRDAIDWQKLADARSPAVQMEDGATTTGQAIAREVMASAIFCAVLIFVMNRLAGMVPNIVTDLTGEGVNPLTDNLYAAATGDITHFGTIRPQLHGGGGGGARRRGR